MTKRKQKQATIEEPPILEEDQATPEQQQPYDTLVKSVFEGHEAELLPHFLPESVYIETLNIVCLPAGDGGCQCSLAQRGHQSDGTILS